MYFAVVCGAKARDIGQHIFSPLGKRHDVVNLAIHCSVRAQKRGMLTAGNFASVIGPQSRDSDYQRTALEHPRDSLTRLWAFRTTAHLFVIARHQTW
jgi:hypothetical protein